MNLGPTAREPWSQGARALCALVLVATGCSDAGLQPVRDAVETVDAELSVSGRYCTEPPDQVAFPVKVLIIVDQSASLQCTDPGNARLAALDLAGRALDPLPNVSFAVVGFASWSRSLAFTTDWDQAVEALAPDSGQGGPATDYQGALATAVRLLEGEMSSVGSATNARTRYEVLFLSDGVPEPRCSAGCDDGDVRPDSLYGVCNTDQELPEGEYVGMSSPCPSYNQPEQILEGVRELQDLADTYGVAGLSVDTVLLFAPESEIAQVCGDVSVFGYIREEAEPLLRAMADEGRGTFRDVNTAASIDVLDFGYVAVRAPYRLTELFAVPTRALSTESGPVPDSDGDGLDDASELEAGTDPVRADSDGDGYSDAIETRYATWGFDSTDPAVPAWVCTDAEDRDGDGLTRCEEDWLGTDPLSPDSDHDGIPDGLEVRLGTDPAAADALDDPDRDGRVTAEELRAGTHPSVFESEDAAARAMTLGVTPEPELADGRRCYGWSMSGLQQVIPRSTIDGKGTNRVLFIAEEEPEGLGAGNGRHKVACVESRYLGPDFKAPRSGRVEGLTADRFVDLSAFVPAEHCFKAHEQEQSP